MHRNAESPSCRFYDIHCISCSIWFMTPYSPGMVLKPSDAILEVWIWMGNPKYTYLQLPWIKSPLAFLLAPMCVRFSRCVCPTARASSLVSISLYPTHPPPPHHFRTHLEDHALAQLLQPSTALAGFCSRRPQSFLRKARRRPIRIRRCCESISKSIFGEWFLIVIPWIKPLHKNWTRRLWQLRYQLKCPYSSSHLV